jgi:formylglycine-generating enzyme required for sulfatase activity
LSEAEWEYAARAGTQTKYPWGDDIGKGNANCNDCDSVWGGKRTAPVGSFPPNPWGLYDMQGNVWQWVEDADHTTYEGAPADGSAWISGGSFSRVLRGGAWDGSLRSADRDHDPPNGHDNNVGFRVARTLSPHSSL